MPKYIRFFYQLVMGVFNIFRITVSAMAITCLKKGAELQEK
jgi:hypothetical protein